MSCSPEMNMCFSFTLEIMCQITLAFLSLTTLSHHILVNSPQECLLLLLVKSVWVSKISNVLRRCTDRIENLCTHGYGPLKRS